MSEDSTPVAADTAPAEPSTPVKSARRVSNPRPKKVAKKVAAEYFERFPKDRYLTEIEGWQHLQSDNIEFTMKRLREPIEEGDGDR